MIGCYELVQKTCGVIRQLIVTIFVVFRVDITYVTSRRHVRRNDCRRHRVPRMSTSQKQDCQMAYFYTKNPDSGKFWWVLQWKMSVYFRDIWSILLPCGIFCGHLVYFTVIWYIFPRFGILYQERSGSPAQKRRLHWSDFSSKVVGLAPRLVV
jgi:hypothetical protein